MVKAGELLGFLDTPQHLVTLTNAGRRFVAADTAERRVQWGEQLLGLRLFREIHDLAAASAEKAIRRERVLETIMVRTPHEDYERTFNTFVRWARFGGLFEYDETSQTLVLGRGGEPSLP